MAMKVMAGHAEDMAIRNNPDLLGRAAYEASQAAVPNYADGTPRPDWDDLDPAARWSWEHPVQILMPNGMAKPYQPKGG